MYIDSLRREHKFSIGFRSGFHDLVKILTCLIIVHTVFSVKSSQKNFRPAMDKCMSSGHKIRHTEEETTPKEGTKVGKSLVLLNK